MQIGLAIGIVLPLGWRRVGDVLVHLLPSSRALRLDGMFCYHPRQRQGPSHQRGADQQELAVGDTMDSLPHPALVRPTVKNGPRSAREHGPQAGDRST